MARVLLMFGIGMVFLSNNSLANKRDDLLEKQMFTYLCEKVGKCLIANTTSGTYDGTQICRIYDTQEKKEFVAIKGLDSIISVYADCKNKSKMLFNLLKDEYHE